MPLFIMVSGYLFWKSAQVYESFWCSVIVYMVHRYCNDNYLVYLAIFFVGLACVMIIPMSAMRLIILEHRSDVDVVGEYSPFVIVISLLLFSGFANLSIKVDLSKLAAKTFYIYLLHAGVWDMVSKVKILRFPNICSIVGAVVLVWSISYVGAVICQSIENFIKKRRRTWSDI